MKATFKTTTIAAEGYTQKQIDESQNSTSEYAKLKNYKIEIDFTIAKGFDFANCKPSAKDIKIVEMRLDGQIANELEILLELPRKVHSIEKYIAEKYFAAVESFTVECEENSIKPFFMRKFHEKASWSAVDTIEGTLHEVKAAFFAQYKTKSAEYRLVNSKGVQVAYC